MSKLFRNSSPGALTRQQAFELERRRDAERQRQMKHARALADEGRGSDTEIAHLTLGEIVVPDALQTPEVLNALRRAATKTDIPLDRFRVGSPHNRANPNTGVPEFTDAPYRYDGPAMDEITVQRSLLTSDPDTNKMIEGLHPSIRYDATRFINAVQDRTGRQLRIPTKDGGTRTFEHQDELYAQSRTKPGLRVTNARGGESYHNYGTAFDVAPLTLDGKGTDYNIDFANLGKIANEFGFEWGGNFTGKDRDMPHFQRTYGYTKDQLRQMMPQGGFPAFPGQRNR